MVSWMHPEKKAVSRLNSDALVTQLPSNSPVGVSVRNVSERCHLILIRENYIIKPELFMSI